MQEESDTFNRKAYMAVYNREYRLKHRDALNRKRCDQSKEKVRCQRLISRVKDLYTKIADENYQMIHNDPELKPLLNTIITKITEKLVNELKPKQYFS